MATVMITGRSVDEVERITNADVEAALGGLPESKRHCSVLVEQAIRAALESWRRMPPGGRDEVVTRETE
jgi:NifU-like protein involved in Fe-S cluster formation